MVAPNNSLALQDRHEAVYRDFFKGASVVVSCATSVWIVGEYITLQGGPGAKVNIPQRVYCALTPSSRFRICRKAMVHQPSTETFRQTWLSEAITARVESSLKNIVAKQGLRPLPCLTVTFLSEAPLFSGLGASGAMSAALILALTLHAGAVAPEEVSAWGNRPSGATSRPFEQVFRSAWFIDCAVQGVSSGTASLCALTGASSPIVFRFDAPTPPRTVEEFVSVPYHWERFSDGALHGKPVDWPLDFTVVYTGQRAPTRTLVRSTESLVAHLRQLTGSADRCSGSVTLGSRLLAGKTAPELLSQYTSGLAVLCADVISSLRQLFHKGADPSLESRFFQGVKLYQSAMAYMGVSTENIERLVRLLNQGDRVAVKITGAGGGGDVVVFSAPRTGFEVERSIAAANARHGFRCSIDYLSERDGVTDDGPRVEHMPDRGIISPLAEELSLSVHVCQGGAVHSSRATAKDLDQIIRQSELLIDLRPKRPDIYVKGDRLKSNELDSATKTAEVISRILKDPQLRLRSDEIKEPNTMTAVARTLRVKVTNPLNRALTDRRLSALEFEFEDLRGGGYVVTLHPPSIRITVIDRGSDSYVDVSSRLALAR
jgi:mevalonate kinase